MFDYQHAKLLVQEGYWAHHIDDGSINGVLEYYQCPPGYCQCGRVDNDSSRCNSIYYYDNDDLQCVCDREGNYIDIMHCTRISYIFPSTLLVYQACMQPK